MVNLADDPPYLTPMTVVTALAGFFAGGASMAFNPFFAVSLIAIVLSVVALRRSRRLSHHVVQGVMRIFAIIGVMGGAGGIVVLLFPGLGVR